MIRWTQAFLFAALVFFAGCVPGEVYFAIDLSVSGKPGSSIHSVITEFLKKKGELIEHTGTRDLEKRALKKCMFRAHSAGPLFAFCESESTVTIIVSYPEFDDGNPDNPKYKDTRSYYYHHELTNGLVSDLKANGFQVKKSDMYPFKFLGNLISDSKEENAK